MVLKMIQQGLIGLIAVGSGVVNDATAQERHGSQEAIEEVVVTATRRSESLQDVSGSLSALTTEDILDLGLDNLQGFARLVPGTQLHQPLKNRSVFTIRGINTDIGDTQLTQEPVALYINDMPATNPYAELVQPDLALYDIERIEVLRGPQGTLFGSGSLGGAVRIITRQPVMNETEASFRVDFADVSEAGLRQRYDGMVNVPLVEDKLALRAVAYVRDAEGWVENTNLGLENGTEDWGARLALQWYPSEKLSARFEVLYEDSDPGDADSWNPEFGEFKRFSLIDESRPYELLMTNATLEYDFGFASLLSSTNFKSVDTSWRTEFGEIPGIGAIVNQSPFFNYDSAVQEFRLVSNSDGPIDWVAGLYYFDNEVDSLLDVEIRGLQEFLQAILGPGAMTAGKLIAAGAVQESEELAAYGDLTWQFSSDWSVSAGLRVFETETVFDQGPSLVFDFATLQDLMVPGFVNVADDNDFTWRTALSYTPNDDRHFYATISKGFRVGQVNPNNGPSFVDPTDIVISPTYDSDESLNFELGLKSTLMDGRVQFNAAAYYIDWTDIQIDAVRVSDNRNFIANAGDAISKGVEFELRALPSDRLDLALNLTLQDAEIDEISELNALLSGAREGDTLPGAAEVLASARAHYVWDVLENKQLVGGIGVQYVDDSPNRFSFTPATGEPNADFAINESYTNVDASLTLVGDQWDLTLYGENLTDNGDAILNIGATLRNPIVTLRPRTVGLRLEYRF